jgi:hypothetical protein
MSTINSVIAFIHPATQLPFYIYGNDIIPTIDELHQIAKIEVPEGTHYEIIDINDVPHEAVPGLTDTPLTEQDIKSYFYQYLQAL